MYNILKITFKLTINAKSNHKLKKICHCILKVREKYTLLWVGEILKNNKSKQDKIVIEKLSDRVAKIGQCKIIFSI